MNSRRQRLVKRKMSKEEIEFLLGTDLFESCPEEARKILLSSMAAKEVPAGEIFIRQGQPARNFYLIQNGSCLVSFERDGESFPVSRLKSGDLVGEMAILTGEKRNANVQAETDVLLWRISRHEFEQLCLAYPPIRDFLTDIVSSRFAQSKFTTDRIIGKYVIREVLGQGGWSIVYRGLHSALNMPVAIKMLKHNMAMDPDFMERFRSEAGIIAQLNHDNIVRVYDVEHIYKTAFIVMEYLEGVPLDYLVDKTPKIEVSRVMDILMQVASGLDYAHNKGVVHQDIKPANIFIQQGDKARIVDFGLALPIGSVDETGFGGTPYYMAPEQIECEEIDRRTDVYSFGIMAYEMLTGQRPFPQKKVGEVFLAHRTTPVPDSRNLRPDVPADLDGIIQRCTQKNPEERFQDFEQVLGSLGGVASNTGLLSRVIDRKSHKIMNIILTYDGSGQVELNKLVDSFVESAESLGSKVHVSDFEN